MLTHVVLFRLTEEADADEVVARLESMRQRVPSLRDIEVGRNVVASERAYDVCLIVRVDDLDALEEYHGDPYHQEVIAFLRDRTTGSVAVDYLTEGGS